MQTRRLGPFDIAPIGLGCMSLSHAYGTPPDKPEAQRVLLEALELGYTHFDTANMYGFGANEELIGETISHRRQALTLASKCVLGVNDEGKREINARPDNIKKTCERALKRLKTDVIDLYYLHRRDFTVPIEDSVGAMADLVQEGKIRTVGLSEMSAETLRKAHRVHPIAAMQTEYSLWTRNAEIAVLDACRELGTTFVAFSPVARGYLTGKLRDLATLPEKDIRLMMPRFQSPHWEANLGLLDAFVAIADEIGCTPGQLALAWVLAKDETIVTIPGTARIDHLRENFAAHDVVLTPDTVARLDALINEKTVSGNRYSPAMQKQIDTEMFPFETA